MQKKTCNIQAFFGSETRNWQFFGSFFGHCEVQSFTGNIADMKTPKIPTGAKHESVLGAAVP